MWYIDIGINFFKACNLGREKTDIISEGVKKTGGAFMDDSRIIQLYFDRSEEAISETSKKYGRYCACIASNILSNELDSEECVNDTYLDLWNTIPPTRPNNLKAFIGKITRRIALDRYDYNTAQKRNSCTAEVTDEFFTCLSPASESLLDEIAFSEAINEFLSTLDTKTRIIFMQRYWYFCSIGDIAKNLSLSESNVKVTLHRTREKLKNFLERMDIQV